MKHIIAIITIVCIALIILYKISLHLFRDKISSIIEYDKIDINNFLKVVDTGDIIQITNRFNPRFLQYTLLGLINGTFYLHSAIVIKSKDGVPYLVHMQKINNNQYNRYSPNLNNNTGGIYIEKLEDLLRLYIKRYGSIFAWYRVNDADRKRFNAMNIINAAMSIRNIKYTTNREILYHIWRRAINLRNKIPKKSAQCNIIIGYILERIGVFPKCDDIYSDYTPDNFDILLDKSGAYESMRQLKIII